MALKRKTVVDQNDGKPRTPSRPARPAGGDAATAIDMKALRKKAMKSIAVSRKILADS
jgi:hypothetical protein